MKSGIRSRRHAEMLLAGVIAARATSYLFSKLIMEGMGMFNLLGIRFLLAFPNFRGEALSDLESISGIYAHRGKVSGTG